MIKAWIWRLRPLRGCINLSAGIHLSLWMERTPSESPFSDINPHKCCNQQSWYEAHASYIPCPQQRHANGHTLVDITCSHGHWSQLLPPHRYSSSSPEGDQRTITHRGRSLWILTVWWWLQSLSAAGRWSDLPSRWSTPPHSWESKPSGSTRLPLQWGTGNRKSSTAYGFPRQYEIMLTECSKQ